MSYGVPWTQKPPPGTLLDPSNELARKFNWFAPCWDVGSSQMVDIVGGVNPVITGAGWIAGQSGRSGNGVAFTSTGTNAQIALPKQLQLQAPITFVIGLRALGSATVFGGIMGLFINNTGTSPYGSAILQYNSPSTSFNLTAAAGAGGATTNFAVPSNTAEYTLVIVFGATTYNVYIYPMGSGAPITYSGSWGATLSATYSGTATLAIGGMSWFSTRNSETNVHFAGIAGSGLSATEAAICGENIWQIFTPQQSIRRLFTPILYSVSGPSSGSEGSASTNFTVTPSNGYTDTISLSDGAQGGTFTPSSLSFAGSTSPQTWTYTPATTGAITLTLASANGGTITGSPLTYTSSSTSSGMTPANYLMFWMWRFSILALLRGLTLRRNSDGL